MNQTLGQVPDTSAIHGMKLLDRHQIKVPHNRIEEHQVNFMISEPRYNKFQLLLFNETVPDDTVTDYRIGSS